MRICDFHNKSVCHLPELKERKRRKMVICMFPFTLTNMNEYKMQEDLGRGSKQNCSFLVGLCRTAKGEALTEEGSVDLCQARRSLGAHGRLQESILAKEDRKTILRMDNYGQTENGLSPASLSCPLQQAAAKFRFLN